ncbi:MAG: DUF6883 domain-containing protein [Gemmatimonadota bacterium]
MAHLPNPESAEIDRRKITDYLLSRTHPVGRGKAAFFEKLGFDAEAPGALESALRELAGNPSTTNTQDTGFGIKYIVDGDLRGPAGNASVRSIWIVGRDSTVARFVTAYPL